MKRGPLTHGHTAGRSTTPEYRTWHAMIQRCHYPKHEKYSQYGARGIVVCDRWRGSFADFLVDMGRRPPGTTLDRKDNAKGYEPGNCRWATPVEQAANRRQGISANAEKMACPAGHAYTPENTRATATGRKCRTCDRLRSAARRAKP